VTAQSLGREPLEILCRDRLVLLQDLGDVESHGLTKIRRVIVVQARQVISLALTKRLA